MALILQELLIYIPWGLPLNSENEDLPSQPKPKIIIPWKYIDKYFDRPRIYTLRNWNTNLIIIQ